MKSVLIIFFGVLLALYILAAIVWGLEKLIARLRNKDKKNKKDGKK